jgi:hypothetical protein
MPIDDHAFADLVAFLAPAYGRFETAVESVEIARSGGQIDDWYEAQVIDLLLTIYDCVIE